MNCGRFRDLVDDLARGEELDGVLLNEALEHAEACATCDALLEESESLTRSLDALAREYSLEQASARVEKSLLQALRRKRAPALRTIRRRWILPAIAGSVAAVALAAVLLTGENGIAPTETSQPRVATAAAMPAVASAEEDSVADLDNLSPGSLAEEEDATGSFLPLSATFDPSSLDDGTIVRVVLSRSALESFGLPLNLEGNAQVVADLIVSSDGTPEAIRVLGPYPLKGS
jgi:hypothetical protein